MSEDSADRPELETDGGDAQIVDVGGVSDGDSTDVHGRLVVGDDEVPVQFDDRIVDAVEQSDDLTWTDLAEQATAADVDLEIGGQSDPGGGVTIPVHDEVDHNLTSASRFDDAQFRFIEDDQIRKLEENGVRYTERVGDWILAKDDLVPSVKERVKALILGEGGLQVDAADPDSDADQRLVDHLQDIYESDVRPSKVVDTVLQENFKNARAVLRATDLQELDLRDLQYVRDGISGQEIYWQDDVTVTTFEVEDEGAETRREIDIEDQDVPAQPLLIGDQVFDISLYDKPPLESIADTAVNKKVMQRLKARKAEITSFGGIVMKADPPAWLDEDEWFDRVDDEDVDDGDGKKPTKLERALRNSLSNAHDWVKEYQSGTTGAIPMHWEIEQVEIPETDDPIDDQIRGYNQDISRRLLVPLDLIELREGAELSRETLFSTLLTTIEGWRQEILRVFDQFAEVQKEIHDVPGEVTHSFPRIGAEDEETVVSLLQYAGVAGLSENEVRQMINHAVEGVDLEIQDEADLDDDELDQELEDRSRQMRDFLDEQQRGPPPEGDDGEDGDGQEGAGDAKGAVGATGTDGCPLTSGFDPDLHPRGPDGRFVSKPGSGVTDAVSKVSDVVEAFESDLNITPPEVVDGTNLGENYSHSMATYEHRQNRLVVNGELLTPEKTQEWGDDGIIAGDTPEHVLAHEMMHVAIHQRDAQPSMWWDGEENETAADLSTVAKQNPNELIAEVGALIATGEPVPDDAMALFEKYSEVGADEIPGIAGATSAGAANIRRRDLLRGAEHYQEGDKVETSDGDRGVVVEVRTADFEGPDGDDVDASEDNPAYVVATMDGADVFRGDDLTGADWGADVDDPAADLADVAQGSAVDGDLTAGPTDWDFPPSWRKSELPARLILLDAWSSMGAQFDCGGDCCKGTMRRSGMSERASDQFCAAMKDRVLLWEGWRRGSGADVDLHASHAFTHGDTLREAATNARQRIEQSLPGNQTAEIRRQGPERFVVLVRNRGGDIAGSVTIRESETNPGTWLAVGTEHFFRRFTDFREMDASDSAWWKVWE